MSFSILSVIILLSMVLFVAWQAYRGYKVGAERAITNLSLLLLSAISAAFLASVDSAVDTAFFSLLKRSGFVRMFTSGLTARSVAYDYVFKLATSAVMTSVYFILLFGLLTIVLNIVKKSINKKRGKAPRYGTISTTYVEKNTRRIGVGLGILSGILMTVVIFTPFAAVPKVAQTVLEIVDLHDHGDLEKAHNSDSRALMSCADEFMGNVVYACGGKMLFDIATTTTDEGGTANFSQEVKAFEKIQLNEINHILPRLVSPYSDDVEKCTEFLSETEGSDLMDLVLLLTLKQSLSAWSGNADYWGMEKPEPIDNPVMRRLVDNALSALGKSSAETVRDDFRMLLELNLLLNTKSDIYSYGDYSEQLNDYMFGGTRSRISGILASGVTTDARQQLADGVAVGIFATELLNNPDRPQEQICEAIAGAINRSYFVYLADDMRISELTISLSTALSENGFAIPDDLAAIIAERMVNNVSFSFGYASSATVKAFFLTYL